jgi:hypothetical protein
VVSESGIFKFCIKVLSDLNLASISMFMFSDLDLGLLYLHVLMLDLDFLQIHTTCYLSILHINKRN